MDTKAFPSNLEMPGRHIGVMFTQLVELHLAVSVCESSILYSLLGVYRWKSGVKWEHATLLSLF